MKTLFVLITSLLATLARGGANDPPMSLEMLMKNSYSAQAIKIDRNTVRIVARKRVPGDPAEVNKPGTSMYLALQEVGTNATLRSAIESLSLNCRYFQVLGYKSHTQLYEQRMASFGPIPERNFTFAPGHYFDDVEIEIEVTIRALPDSMPAAKRPTDAVDAETLLRQEVQSRRDPANTLPQLKEIQP